jgi:hypothetical protein
MRHRRPEAAPCRRAFLITQANFSDIGQRCRDLTRPGGPKSESIGGIQSAGSSKPNRFPPGVPFKPLFQGQTCLATDTKTGLILLILDLCCLILMDMSYSNNIMRLTIIRTEMTCTVDHSRQIPDKCSTSVDDCVDRLDPESRYKPLSNA